MSISTETAASTSSALVPYDPTAYQNSEIKPLPVGWTTASKTLISFDAFPRLPKDVRFLIWDLLKPARHVEIGVKVWMVPMVIGTTRLDKGVGTLYSPTPRPLTLSICKESREMTKNTYRCFFDFVLVQKSPAGWTGTVSGDELEPYKKNYIYINPAVDTVCFKTECWVGENKVIAQQIKPRDFTAIRNLTLCCPVHWLATFRRNNPPAQFTNGFALSIVRIPRMPAKECSLVEVVEHFPALRKLRLDGNGDVQNVGLVIRELYELDKQHNNTGNIDFTEYEHSMSALVHKLLQEYKDENPEWKLPSITF